MSFTHEKIFPVGKEKGKGNGFLIREVAEKLLKADARAIGGWPPRCKKRHRGRKKTRH